MKTNFEMAKEADLRDSVNLERFAALVRADAISGYAKKIEELIQERDALRALAQPERPWVGLTEEEILSDDILRYYYGMNGGAGPVSQKGKKVVAAIEAKLKEKNT